MNITEIPTFATSKLTVLLGAGYGSVAGLLGAVVSGAGHENVGLMAIVTAVAGIFGGVVAKLPDIMRARSESRNLEVTMQDKGQESLIKHIYENMDRERVTNERTVANLRTALEKSEKECVILRRSKHTAVNECHRMILEFRNLQDDCSRAGMNIPEFTPPDLAKILRDEDSSMEQVAGIPTPHIT